MPRPHSLPATPDAGTPRTSRATRSATRRSGTQVNARDIHFTPKRRLCHVSTQVTPVKEPEPPVKLTKAEKQKLYREKKKQELGYDEYRTRENARLKKYKKPMAELSSEERAKLRAQN